MLPLPVRFFLSFLIVLGLIGLLNLVVRRFRPGRYLEQSENGVRIDTDQPGPKSKGPLIGLMIAALCSAIVGGDVYWSSDHRSSQSLVDAPGKSDKGLPPVIPKPVMTGPITVTGAQPTASSQETSVNKPPVSDRSVTTVTIARCPEGYEPITRSTGKPACAKDIVPGVE